MQEQKGICGGGNYKQHQGVEMTLWQNVNPTPR